MINIGFTGTRRGMTPEQQDTLRFLLAPWPRPIRLHHGLCVGSDAQAHAICRDLDIELEGHPPTNPRLMAVGLEGFAKMNAPLPYLQRNGRIVQACQELIGTPAEIVPARGGTWSTISYALKLRRKVTIIYPEGNHEVYLGDER
jgi:tRNA U34 5-methylaminomethyl-2-thiouridine-forming methyltransferase MnmC